MNYTQPWHFKSTLVKKVTVIIDFFEIFTDKPFNMTVGAQTWSNYKQHNTAKFLIGISPQGTASFVSSGWGGRVSNKHLTDHSKFLDNLKYGDLVLADRGFELRNL